MKRTRGTLLIAALLGAGTAACGPITPVNPTWKDDIRPLIVSRCLRCHDGSTNGDVQVTGSTAGQAFNFSAPEDLPSPLPPGLMLLQSMGVKAVKGELKPLRRMPPPPNEALEDWQIEILELWATSPR
jgi:hypothetical protein